MSKKSFIIILSLLIATSLLPVYPQSFCQASKIHSTAGSTEKYVYKQYPDEDGKPRALHLAVVRPVDDLPDKKRPLVVGVHSGGFLDFCPFSPCYMKYSEGFLTEHFTPQGVVTASVEYRLTSPLDLKPPKIQDEKLKEAHYKAIQDVREAIKFIFENAGKLSVDPDNVFLVGTSAGAITVLHAALLDDEEVPKELIEKYGRLAKREKIKGVISFSGALYDLSYLDADDNIPLMVVHGTEDFIVPIDKGYYLKMKHLTPVYGGRAVYDEALKKGIPAKGFFYDYGHSLPKRLSGDVFKTAHDFIRSNLNCSGF